MLALAGCASTTGSSSSVEATSSAAETVSSSAETPTSTGMVNPWSDEKTADEAAAGAGIDSFTVPIGTTLTLGPLEESQTTYRCMDGIAEANIDVAAVNLCIRKGTSTAAVEEGDISGDYNTYTFGWKQNVSGLEVYCAGNRDGDATKTIWTDNGMNYSIVATGLGGDDNFGLSPEDVSTLVSAIK